MVQGYFTLPEAAQYLGLAPDELRRMAQRNQIRSFQDRGTLRFRIQDIQELARQRGLTSDPDLVLGEPPAPKSSATPRVAPPKSGPRSGPKTPPKTPQPSSAARNKNDVFDFEFDAEDSIDIGREVLDAGPTSSKRSSKANSPRSGAPKSGTAPKSGAAPKSAARGGQRSGATPREPMKSGSDSDVKLVADGSELGFSVGSAATPRVAGESGVRLGESSPRKSKLGGSRPSQLGANSPKPKSQGTPQPVDSGIRLVPMGGDEALGASNDEIPLGAMPAVSASDSDVRLERAHEPPASEEAMLLTEEINLDEEIRKQEAALQKQSKTRFKPKSQVKLTPPNSPFELSEHDFDEPSGSQAKSKTHEDSSDFDLTPAGGDEDFSLDLSEDALGGEPGVLSGPASGVNLAKPGDSGISLEEGIEDLDLSLEVADDSSAAPVPNDSSDFELSLADPSEEQPAGAESSEFELSLDDGVGMEAGGSDSEFELSLDESSPGDASDSEFELTLDDSSGEMAAATPQVKASGKDIFESDQDLVSLDDSGSEVGELDGDSSDFELALDDSEVISEDESGSQVVALDEEESIDEGAQTLATADFDVPEEEGEGSDFGELDVEADAEPEAEAEAEEEVEREVQVVEKVKLIQPAPWGAMPVVLMLPCVIVMFLVGIMGYEMVQSSNGFRQTGFLTRTFAGLMGMDTKK